MDGVLSFDTTQPLISEIKQQLPRMADMLGALPEEVQILNYSWFPREYMSTKLRDRIVETAGLLEDMPHLQRQRLQFPGPIGNGIYKYQNYIHKDLFYLLYVAKGHYGDEIYLVIKKGDLYKLKRTAHVLNKLANQNTKPPVLEDGLLETIETNTIRFLLKAKKIEKYGVKIKRGIILDGPPGNGKTMLCRYIQKVCSQNGIDWGVITSAEIDAAYNDKNLNELFTRYQVSFFDDIDIQYMDRKSGNGKMACSLLTAMDGMYEGGHLVRIFTTNEEVKDLDPAFTRPGRIDKIVTLKKPDGALRKKLVLSWPEEILEHIDVELCVSESRDFSFAELEAIRTFLVTNKILGDGTWDLEAAFQEFNSRQAENLAKGVGFSSTPLKKHFPDAESPVEAPPLTVGRSQGWQTDETISSPIT
jgi:hypothetical protein